MQLAFLSFCSIFVCLLVVEVFIRMLGLAPGINRIEIDMPHGSFETSLNPVLRYVPRANSPGVNSYGIRDYEYDIKKSKETFRILVIGDSVGYGYCNNEEVLSVADIFPKKLEGMLQHSNAMNVEVINLSVSGYDTVQEVEFLYQKGLALSPDIVLVAYCLNDNFDASAELLTLQDNPQYSINNAIGQKLFLKSHLVRWVWLMHWAPDSKSAPKAEALSRTEQGFLRLVELAKGHDFQPIIVVFPLFESIQSYSWFGQHKRVEEYAVKHGIPFLDLLNSFDTATSGELTLLQGRCNREHPNEEGHRVAAESIHEFLVTGDYLKFTE